MIRLLPFLFILFSIGLFAQKSTISAGFIENKGQVIDQNGNPNPAVKYLLNTNGLNVQLKKNGFSYDVYEMKKIGLTKKDRQFYDGMKKEDGKQNAVPDYSLEQVFHRVDIDFEGSNAEVELISSEKSKDYDNYYTVKNVSEGILMVYKFQKVTYKNLYPKIDVVFFIPEDATKVVEYNFVIHPGGKISDIKMQFNGVKTDLIDSKIKMETRFGSMEETLPLSWTEDGLAREDIAVSYKKINKNVYGFDFDESQTGDKTIVIDPVPVRLWGTYYGGSDYEFPYEIKVNTADELYMIGSTMSLNNIATVGSYQSVYDGDWLDLFIAKFNSSGERLWGTYAPILDLNGNRSIAIDSNSNLYLSSRELVSTNLATPGAYQTVKNAYYDTYFMKYSSQGFLLWRTYYGGNSNEDLDAICTDTQNNVYIVGSTSSSNVMSSPGAHQVNLSSPSANDGFIAKFTPDGQRLWGTYFGGNNADFIKSCIISDDNFLYIVGQTNSSTGIATTGSNISANPLQIMTGFINKFSLDGERIWGTYTEDRIYPQECIIKGSMLYVSGLTVNETAGTAGTYFENFTIDPYSQFGNPIEYNSFIMKYNVQTQQKIWFTYFFEAINRVLINNMDDIYFCGQTRTWQGITTPNAYVSTKIPNEMENYIVKLNNQGQRVWGTYYSGNGQEFQSDIALDNLNFLYLYGMTHSTSGISTAGSFQSTKNGDQELYLVKFKDCLSSVTVSSNSPVCVGSSIELIASGGANYSWTGPNGFTSSLANPVISTASAAANGEYFCTISGSGECDDTKSILVVVGDTLAPEPDIDTLPTLTGDCNSLTIPVPTATDGCLGSIAATTTSSLTYTQAGTYTIIWNYSDGTNNTIQNQTIEINPQPLPLDNGPSVFCKQDNITLNDLNVTGQNLQWYNAITAGALLPASTLVVDGMTYFVSQTINGCESERIAIQVSIIETVAPTGATVQTFCDTQVLTLADFVVTGTDLLFYDSAVGGNLLPIITPLIDGETYYTSQTLNGCESILRLALIPDIMSGVPANGYVVMMCDDLGDGIEMVDLSDYNNELIGDPTIYDFSYYNNATAAENGNPGTAISGFSSYPLSLGLNTIYVRIVFDNSCYEVVALELTVVALPKFTMKDTYAVCENGFVTITADSGFDSYTWSTGVTTQAITVSQGGSYSITVTKNTGTVTCSSTKNITVEVSEKATITAIETVDWTTSENMISVFVNGSSDYEYSIDGINFQNSNQFYNLPNGEYTVYVNDIKGCGVAKKDVYLLMYPKYFTPNGDSYNDFWGIEFYKNEINLVVKVFDRYGKFIKLLTASDPVWDGTFNGNKLPATDYWFTVIRQDGTEYKGHFTLKR